ncbi:MAG: hypothetical protein ACJAXK_003262 [Yoonia sp.]|jgi:hypothetical protein
MFRIRIAKHNKILGIWLRWKNGCLHHGVSTAADRSATARQVAPRKYVLPAQPICQAKHVNDTRHFRKNKPIDHGNIAMLWSTDSRLR